MERPHTVAIKGVSNDCQSRGLDGRKDEYLRIHSIQIKSFFNYYTTSIPPLFATGLGALELLGWRKKKAALAACRTN